MYLKALQFSVVCPEDPSWYVHIALCLKLGGYVTNRLSFLGTPKIFESNKAEIQCTQSELDQTEVVLGDLSDGDCNLDSQLEEEQTEAVVANA